jgi:hypothetical protein
MPLYPGNRIIRCTWADRPTAAAAGAGARVIVTDYRNTEWVSDGTNLVPAGDGQLLYLNSNQSLASPQITLTGNDTNQYFVLPQNCLIPAGMLTVGRRLDVQVLFRKYGSHTGLFRVAMATSAAGAGAQQIATQASNAASGTFVSGQSEAVIYSGGFRGHQARPHTGSIAAGSSTAAVYDNADANIHTADRLVVFGILASFTDSQAELLSYAVSIR